jgi:DNA modification methylase
VTKVQCLNEAHGENFGAYHGDCVSVVSQLPNESVDFSIYSPPFSNLFTYSDSQADMGNAVNDAEFVAHYGFLLRELFRVTVPGRLSAVHCSDLPLQKWKDGMIGIKDLSGDIIDAHEAAGWVLHSRVTIWKCPVVEMTRTKALGLLYKQLIKDSGRSRTGMPDYLLVFRKPGDNPKPITHDRMQFPVEQWQEWASPVWMSINQTRTLNVRAAKEEKDEKHLCPLQLDVIERALALWSNPGDVVLSPFMGIGSEGVTSLNQGRRFVGVELKESYFRMAVQYLETADRQQHLFADLSA